MFNAIQSDTSTVQSKHTHETRHLSRFKTCGFSPCSPPRTVRGGGEAHKTAAAAMAGQMPAEENSPPPKTSAQLALDRAQLCMDVVALGAEADAAAGLPRSWDDARGDVAEWYREAGLEDVAAFVRRD